MPGPLEFDIGIAVSTTIDPDGFLLTQYDAEGEQASGVQPFETHHMLGFQARSLDPVTDAHQANGISSGHPNAGKACQLLLAMEGSQGHCWAMEDPRAIALLPAIRPGESIFYSCFGSFIRQQADGSINMLTTDAGGSPIGRAIQFQVTPTGRVFAAPWGKETFDNNGYRLRVGSSANSPKLSMGYIAGGLPLFGASGASYVRIQADMIDIDARVLSIGATGSLTQPVAQAAPLVGVLTSIAASLTAIQAALASATPASGITSAQIAASTAATTIAVAAVASALATISSQTAIG